MASAPRVLGTLGRQTRLVDPRDGDIETDASSTESRSLLALAGNLLAEVSLLKMAAAFVSLVVIPAVLIGLVPVIVTIWVRTLSSGRPGVGGIGGIFIIVVLLTLAWFGGRSLLRVAERSFWSLNAMAIQPGYVTWREALLHVSGRVIGRHADEAKEAHVRAAASALSGIMICVISLIIIRLVWPATHWVGTLNDLRTPHWLALTAIANAVAVGFAYLAVAGLIWGFADATMPQPRELRDFRVKRELKRTWRVAHMSDIHVVGEKYGFRLGSGRAGPRGNDALVAAFQRLDELHRREPLDAIVITGDLTDAGTSAEWAELLDIFERFPRLTPLMVALPGNHDVNIVDRSNPARLDLPTSPKKRLREVRTISALASIQGTHVRVIDGDRHCVGDTIDHTLAPRAPDIVAFAEGGARRLARATDDVWVSLFPMVHPPAQDDGLGIIALNSNAETHFSFTNALGFIPLEHERALEAAFEEYPRAYWIIALHHHIVEHPKLGHALADRVGTTLINGTWFTRLIRPFGNRAVVMHGHRHIDWMGECGGLRILSAPSATMPSTGHDDVYFYIHTVGVDAGGRVALATPERVDVVTAH